MICAGKNQHENYSKGKSPPKQPIIFRFISDTHFTISSCILGLSFILFLFFPLFAPLKSLATALSFPPSKRKRAHIPLPQAPTPTTQPLPKQKPSGTQQKKNNDKPLSEFERNDLRRRAEAQRRRKGKPKKRGKTRKSKPSSDQQRRNQSPTQPAMSFPPLNNQLQQRQQQRDEEVLMQAAIQASLSSFDQEQIQQAIGTSFEDQLLQEQMLASHNSARQQQGGENDDDDDAGYFSCEDEEDEELMAAIALSMQLSGTPATEKEGDEYKQEEGEEKVGGEGASEKKKEERHVSLSSADVPREPEDDDERAVTFQIRLPDGRTRISRKFLPSDRLGHLFRFVEEHTRGKSNLRFWERRGNNCDLYKFVSNFPKRNYTIEEEGKTLDELGLFPSPPLLIVSPDDK